MRVLVAIIQLFAISAIAAPVTFKRQVINHQGSARVSGGTLGTNGISDDGGMQVGSALTSGDLAHPFGFKRQVVVHEAPGQFSDGASAVSNSNTNNGVQVDSSLVTGGASLKEIAEMFAKRDEFGDFNFAIIATPPDTNPGGPVNGNVGGRF